MKTTLLFSTLFLLALAVSTNQVNAQSKNWIVLTADNQPLMVNAVDQLNDESVILVGKVYHDGDNKYGSGEFIISKMSADGDMQWSKKINSSYGYSFNGIHHTGNSLLIDVIRTGSNDEANEELIKLDLNGNITSTVKFNNETQFYNEARFLDLPGGNIALLRSLLNKMEIMCLDSNLSIIWAKDIVADPTCTRNAGLALCADSSGNICMVGKTGNHLVLCMVSSTGEWLFGNRFDDQVAYVRPYQVFSTADGFVILGLFAKSGKLEVENSFVCKTSLSGNILWTKTLSDPDAENDFELSNGYKLANGNILITGMAGNSNVIGEMNDNGGIIWTSMIGGTKYFTGSPAAVGLNKIISVQNEDIAPYGNITSIANSSTTSFLRDEVCNYFQKNALVDEYSFDISTSKIAALNVSVIFPETSPDNISLVDNAQNIQVQTRCNTIESTEEVKEVTPLYMHIYPNPARDEINIVMDGFDSKSDIKILNMNGQLMFDMSINSPDTNEFTFPVSSVPGGIYLAVYRGQDGQTMTQKFIVQH